MNYYIQYVTSYTIYVTPYLSAHTASQYETAQTSRLDKGPGVPESSSVLASYSSC